MEDYLEQNFGHFSMGINRVTLRMPAPWEGNYAAHLHAVSSNHVLRMLYIGIIFFSAFAVADVSSSDLTERGRRLVLLVRVCGLVPFMVVCAVLVRCARQWSTARLEALAFAPLFLGGAFLSFTTVMKNTDQASVALQVPPFAAVGACGICTHQRGSLRSCSSFRYSAPVACG